MLFYEAPHKLKRTLEDLRETFGGDRRVVLAREITKIHEEFLRFTLDEANEYYNDENIKGEFVIVLEGKEKEEELPSEESVEELMKKYTSQGVDKKEAMKLVAKEKGITKSEVYKQCLKMEE